MASSLLLPAGADLPDATLAPIAVPPLENGDRLTRAEFERRYEAMPPEMKAELIEGEVFMSSPVRQKQHGGPHFNLIGLLWLYKAHTPGIEGGDNATIRLDLDNEPQPDGLLYIVPECGGKVRIDEEDFINGAPDLAAEISSSSVSIDLGKKLNVYRRNQVQEYLVWRVLDRAIDWFYWHAENFQRLAPASDGISRSRVFPGLWLDTAAIVLGDFVRASIVLQQGLQSQEHVDFVARLQSRKATESK